MVVVPVDFWFRVNYFCFILYILLCVVVGVIVAIDFSLTSFGGDLFVILF